MAARPGLPSSTARIRPGRFYLPTWFMSRPQIGTIAPANLEGVQMSWRYFLPSDLDDETRALIWRLCLTVTLILYIAWSNSKYGHVTQEQFLQHEFRVHKEIEAVRTKVETLENTAVLTEADLREFRAEVKSAELFNLQVRLCEIRESDNGPGSEVANEYERRILEMASEYRRLTDSNFPLKRCTGLGGYP